jgi:4-hydroxybenzoate polyprenyltransferase
MTQSRAAPAVESSPLLFLHIPKTAGTSLKHLLFHRFPAQACLMDPHGPAGEAADPARYALTAGHLDYDFVRRYRRRPFVITCLRRPVDRALSAYYYQRTPRLAVEIRSTASRYGEAVTRQVLDDLRRVNSHGSLADFLRHEPELAERVLGNVQTRHLAGAEAAAAHADRPERLLATAREHLESCQGILLAERLSESWAQVARRLAWEEPGIVPRDNTTPARLAPSDHDSALLAALARLSSLDAALYRFAEELVEARLHADVPSAARGALPDSLPDAADFTFDQPIRGSGWHVREADAAGWYCWTGQHALLRLALASSGDHTLRLQVDHAACPEAWRGLEVCVNGRPVKLASRGASPPASVVAEVPALLLADSTGRVEIGLRVPQTVCPAERDPDNPDSRRLGIALSRLQLVPRRAAESAPRARTRRTDDAAAPSVKDLVRLDNWWCAKIPPLLAIAYVQILSSGLGPGPAMLQLASFVLSVACVAAYGHVVNDLFDREADRRAGKPNAVARLGPGRPVVIAGALAVAGFLPGLVAGYSVPAALPLFLNYLWPTLYSAPPARLKERGLWGVACDAAGSHVTPTLFALVVFAAPAPSGPLGPLFPVIAVLWSSALGLKGILHHQVADRENDVAAGVSTFATAASAQAIDRFLPRHNLYVELPVSVLMVWSVAGDAPLAVASLAGYGAVELVKHTLGFQFALDAGDRRASIPFANELFYVTWFPAAACVQVALLGPAWLWLPLLHGLAFRPVFQAQARDLRAVTSALRERLGRPPAPSDST